MTLISKQISVFGWDLTVSVARSRLVDGGVRYSERIELQKTGDSDG